MGKAWVEYFVVRQRLWMLWTKFCRVMKHLMGTAWVEYFVVRQRLWMPCPYNGWLGMACDKWKNMVELQ
ncbi:hypothetical protein [Calothrix rhizosoleniae]|uniref:hypothetical protein n=1 Tax=Calothrix rhizosoleniae TaxID=888997 RepID=UPI001177585F|nr:hypothetical protein [Calothrix rhizosoleniae]